jgi:hypothetical protein
MRLRDWRPSDEHGHVPVHRWVVRARVSDGAIVRELWFDDRDEADAFLLSRLLNTPWPHYEPLEYPATWSILVFVTLTTTSASAQNYTVPADYTTAGSVWNVIAGGGAGGRGSVGSPGTGGAGGAFSQQTNVALTPSDVRSFFIQPFAAAPASFAAGNPGLDAWFNGATLLASSVGAKGGGGGSVNVSAATGGAAASGVGALKKSGGNGGLASVASSAGGGGGAAGQDADGTNAPAANAASTAFSGGAGNGGVNGGGTAGTGGTAAPGVPGGSGNNLAAGIGSGGGGGNGINNAAGGAGLYGGGGGGSNPSAAASGSGAQGLIYGTYGAAAGSGLRYNMPMMGV